MTMSMARICRAEPASPPTRALPLDASRLMDTVRMLLVRQANCCAVCAEELVVPPNVADQLTGVVDRDAATLEVRGLLCHRCNAGLALFAADPELVHRAAVYLSAPSACSAAC